MISIGSWNDVEGATFTSSCCKSARTNSNCMYYFTCTSHLEFNLSVHVGMILYIVHIELAPHCTIRGYMLCAIDFSWGFWYDTLPCPFTFEAAKLLGTPTSVVKWYKSHAHNSFLSQLFKFIMCQLNVKEVQCIHVNTCKYLCSQRWWLCCQLIFSCNYRTTAKQKSCMHVCTTARYMYMYTCTVCMYIHSTL